MGAAPSKRYKGIVCIGAYNDSVKNLCKLLINECENLVLIVPMRITSETYPSGTFVLEGCGSIGGSMRSCFDIIETLGIDVHLCMVLPPELMGHCDINRSIYYAYVGTAFEILSEYSRRCQIVFVQLGPKLALEHCGLLGLLKCVRLERPNLRFWEIHGVGNLLGFWDYQAAYFISRLLILSGV